MRRLAPTVLLLLLGLGGLPEAAGADDALAWRLGRSDMLRYERTTVTIRDGVEVLAGAKIVTLHGHDLRDGGQYSPAGPTPDDLPQLLAFRLPPPRGAGVKFDWQAHDAVGVRIKGAVEIVKRDAQQAKAEGSFAFASRGTAQRGDRWWYADGVASSHVVFDSTEGVVRSARLDLAYSREDLGKQGPAAFTKQHVVYRFELKAVERMRPADFQARVDAAIERGLAHLRSLQKPDGMWKPHGNYDLGTTGLAVLTLVVCGVSRDDPAIQRGLASIFAQEAVRTYEQAVCLMAIDRAWTPAAELERLAAGQPVEAYVRDLPPGRMAWVRRTAAALEAGASSPGSWGYPPTGNTLLRFDTSNTQYAALGLRAATHLGHEVAENTWLGLIRHCKLVRERKGPKGQISLIHQGEAVADETLADRQDLQSVAEVAGFRYSTLESHGHVDAAMTCGGITILLIARHQLEAVGSHRLNAKLHKSIHELLSGGWAWLDANWAMDRHPLHPSGSWYWYYLYSLERAGVLEGVKRVGGKDWYFEGAMQLLHRQGEKKGDWNETGQDATAPTCFALLFLKRGTSPLGAPVTGK